MDEHVIAGLKSGLDNGAPQLARAPRRLPRGAEAQTGPRHDVLDAAGIVQLSVACEGGRASRSRLRWRAAALRIPLSSYSYKNLLDINTSWRGPVWASAPLGLRRGARANPVGVVGVVIVVIDIVARFSPQYNLLDSCGV